MHVLKALMAVIPMCGAILAAPGHASVVDVSFDFDITPTRVRNNAVPGGFDFDANPNPKYRINVSGSFSYDMNELLQSPIIWEPGHGLGGIPVTFTSESYYGDRLLNELFATVRYQYAESLETYVSHICITSKDVYAETPENIGCVISAGTQDFLLGFNDYEYGAYAIATEEYSGSEIIPFRQFYSNRGDEGEFIYTIQPETLDVPAPGGLALLGIGGFTLTRYRRSRKTAG